MINYLTKILPLFFLGQLALHAQTLTISYTEKPPYYYTDSSTKMPAGFLLEKTIKILSKAEITDYKLISLPPKRILKEMSDNVESECSIGWFINEERKKIAQFSLPIHRDSPMVLIINNKDFAAMNGVKSLDELKTWIALKENSQKMISLGKVSGFSYGDVIDQFITSNFVETTSKKHFLDQSSQDPIQLLSRISLRRINFGFFDQKEFEFFIQKEPKIARDLTALKLKGMPEGKERYLMCSRKVNNETMVRINNAIKNNLKGSLLSPWVHQLALLSSVAE